MLAYYVTSSRTKPRLKCTSTDAKPDQTKSNLSHWGVMTNLVPLSECASIVGRFNTENVRYLEKLGHPLTTITVSQSPHTYGFRFEMLFSRYQKRARGRL